MATHGLRRTFRERAVAVGITPQVLFDWLRRGRLTGKQLAKAHALADYANARAGH